MQTSQVILVDLYPAKSASVTANVCPLRFCPISVDLLKRSSIFVRSQNNLVRCIIGAVGTSVVDPMRRAVGMGWTMVIVNSFVYGKTDHPPFINLYR